MELLALFVRCGGVPEYAGGEDEAHIFAGPDPNPSPPFCHSPHLPGSKGSSQESPETIHA